MPEGHLPVRSYLAVPVVSRSGEVLGGLFFGHAKPGVFTERAERLVAGIAAQAAIAMDNARLYRAERETAAKLREADRRKDEFLAMLAHELRNPLAPIRNGAAAPARSRGAGSDRAEQARDDDGAPGRRTWCAWSTTCSTCRASAAARSSCAASAIELARRCSQRGRDQPAADRGRAATQLDVEPAGASR